MQTINISKKKFETLQPYKLPNCVYNTEGTLYILPIKNKWHKENKLLKKLFLTNGPSFGNKLFTINSLIDSREQAEIEEAVYPEEIAAVNHEIIGPTMPLIESINLKTALSSIGISTDDKIKYLKQIGIILEKMKKIRKYTNIKDFYINDLHESNFIIDRNNNVRLVDMDSCKINGNQVSSSKYLSTGKFINEIYKYHKDETKTTNNKYTYSPLNYIVPDENTDLYCYIIIILNFLYSDNTGNFTLEEFYNYLEYLKYIGLSQELIDIFEKITYTTPNENPYELLDELKPVVGRSSHYVYSLIKKKSI